MDQDDVRRIARTLPGARLSDRKQFGFGVAGKDRKERGFVWEWLERIDPKKARVPCPSVLAVRVANETEKAALLDADADVFFTEPHYNGYPAVLVRLANVGEDMLRMLIVEAWRCMAAPDLVAKLDARGGKAAKKAGTKKAGTKKTGAKKAGAKKTGAKVPAA